MRKDPLVNNNIYHVISRSIAKYKIFNSKREYCRFIDLINLYKHTSPPMYSQYSRLSEREKYELSYRLSSKRNYRVIILAYCIMPTHIHLLVKQITDNGISKFTSDVLNSYTKYFNSAHGRKGPLWEGRFKSVLVDDDYQLLHLTRYIHLNPCSAGLADKPELWKYSSYSEYLSRKKVEDICDFRDLIEMPPKTYKSFCDDRKNYQQELSIIKHQILENYSG